MTTYGGFAPGTWDAWSLNLLSQLFVNAGISRGFQVTQTTTPSMAVKATLDGTSSDGVLYIANGAFMRITEEVTFSITSNSSGSTRTDALVAKVDPTNSSNTSLSVQANWATGFTPPDDTQFVVALISVPDGASSIVDGDITMNSSAATITGTNISGSSTLTASDGLGVTLTDSSTTSVMTLAMTGLTTGLGRSFILQTTDTSAIGHSYTFGTSDVMSTALGNLVAATSASASNGTAGYRIWFGTTDPGSKASEGDLWIDG